MKQVSVSMELRILYRCYESTSSQTGMDWWYVASLSAIVMLQSNVTPKLREVVDGKMTASSSWRKKPLRQLWW